MIPEGRPETETEEMLSQENDDNVGKCKHMLNLIKQ